MPDSRQALHILYAEREAIKKRREINNKYHAMFIESPMGQVVLADILKDLGFDEPIDPRDEATNSLRSYATKLLEKCGIMTGDTQGLVRALAHYIPENKEEE